MHPRCKIPLTLSLNTDTRRWFPGWSTREWKCKGRSGMRSSSRRLSPTYWSRDKTVHWDILEKSELPECLLLWTSSWRKLWLSPPRTRNRPLSAPSSFQTIGSIMAQRRRWPGTGWIQCSPKQANWILVPSENASEGGFNFWSHSMSSLSRHLLSWALM